MREYRTSVAASSVSSSFPRFLWSAAPCSPARGGGGGEQGFFSHGPAGGGRERGKVSKRERREEGAREKRRKGKAFVGSWREGRGGKEEKKKTCLRWTGREDGWVSERASVCVFVCGGWREVEVVEEEEESVGEEEGRGRGPAELSSYKLMRQATQSPPSCANCFSPFLILSLVC